MLLIPGKSMFKRMRSGRLASRYFEAFFVFHNRDDKVNLPAEGFVQHGGGGQIFVRIKYFVSYLIPTGFGRLTPKYATAKEFRLWNPLVVHPSTFWE